MIAALLQTVFFCIVLYYLAYALLELRMVLQARKGEKMRLTKLHSAALAVVDRSRLPLVSVLLPVCNESSVVERLIDAVCGLDYPPEKLEVLVLNDSTDETTALAAASGARHVARGVDIRLCSRENSHGFKAGNLSYGVTVARGDFLAIFDADFIPPEDFLLKTIPGRRFPADRHWLHQQGRLVSDQIPGHGDGASAVRHRRAEPRRLAGFSQRQFVRMEKNVR